MYDRPPPSTEKRRFTPPGRLEYASTAVDGNNGMFLLPFRLPDPQVTYTPTSYLLAMTSAGSNEVPWEHVSVTVKDQRRCPTWEEMDFVKKAFWKPEECVMQLHPPVHENISCHPYCLHLWKPWIGDIPRPPAFAVGPSAVSRPADQSNWAPDKVFEQMLAAVKKERELG